MQLDLFYLPLITVCTYVSVHTFIRHIQNLLLSKWYVREFISVRHHNMIGGANHLSGKKNLIEWGTHEQVRKNFNYWIDFPPSEKYVRRYVCQIFFLALEEKRMIVHSNNLFSYFQCEIISTYVMVTVKLK